MGNNFLWRYLTMGKYQKLLESRSIYFPRASRLSDKAEGSWLGYVLHTTDYENRVKYLPDHITTLGNILESAHSDNTLLKLRCWEILSRPDNLPKLLNDILSHAALLPVTHIRGYLESFLDGWQKAIDIHAKSEKNWRSQIKFFRDATYINCWCKSEHISDLMWTSFCGGKSGVAIRISRNRLDELLSDSSEILAKHSLSSSVSDVTYKANLQQPTPRTYEEISHLMTSVPVSGIVQFLVKSSIYSDENELRAILYPKRKMRDPLVNMNPEIIGLDLPISPGMKKKDALNHFIDKVCVHPLLTRSDSIISEIKQLHVSNGLEQLPLDIRDEKAFGAFT